MVRIGPSPPLTFFCSLSDKFLTVSLLSFNFPTLVFPFFFVLDFVTMGCWLLSRGLWRGYISRNTARSILSHVRCVEDLGRNANEVGGGDRNRPMKKGFADLSGQLSPSNTEYHTRINLD